MGGALARAVCGVLNTKVYVSDYNEEKGRAFARENGAEFCDNEYIARECDFVFLAVKPGVLASVIEPLKAAFSENSSSVIVSMAAGNLKKAESHLSKENVALRDKAERLLEAVLTKNSYDVCAMLAAPKHKRETF